MEYRSVVFSGLPASGKSTLSDRLHELYGWPVYSIGGLWREKYAELYPNKKISFADYWKSTSREDNLNMNLVAKEIFKKGNVIGDSRYAIYCKDSPEILLVLVVADLDVRADRVFNHIRYQGKSLKEVKHILKKREADEVAVGKELFGKSYDYRNPIHYHLTINSGVLTVEQEVSSVRNLLEGINFKPTNISSSL